jgi:hypothetical protein
LIGLVFQLGYGDDLIPEEITEKLNISPSFSSYKGQSIFGKDGKFKRIAKFGSWIFDYEQSMTDEWDCNNAVLELL